MADIFDQIDGYATRLLELIQLCEDPTCDNCRRGLAESALLRQVAFTVQQQNEQLETANQHLDTAAKMLELSNKLILELEAETARLRAKLEAM